MKLLCASLVFAASACIGACALLQPPPQKVEAPLRPGEVLSAQAAAEAVTIGKSSKADVRAALGEAVVIDFESGYEVWVYRERLREKATPPATEFVLLFAPSGVLAKTRIR
jgi:hypothetical protein